MSNISQNTINNDSIFLQFAEFYTRYCDMQIFPLIPRTKKPITKNGYKDASKDISTILEWWKKNPHANIGCATGLTSGLTVLDIDAKPNADLILQEFERKFSKIPMTPTAISGGGGYHFYFKSSVALPCRVKIIHGIDFRAEGGYIVLPPSIHENGQPYRWMPGRNVNDLPFAEIPRWLFDLVKHSTVDGGESDGCFFKNIKDDILKEGIRTSTMVSVIGHLLARRIDLKLLKALVLSFNQIKFDPPLQEKEVLKILDSISKRELEKRMKRGLK